MASRSPGWIHMKFDHLWITGQLQNGLKSSGLDSVKFDNFSFENQFQTGLQSSWPALYITTVCFSLMRYLFFHWLVIEEAIISLYHSQKSWIVIVVAYSTTKQLDLNAFVWKSNYFDIRFQKWIINQFVYI